MGPLFDRLPVTPYGRTELESDLVWLDCVRRVILADGGDASDSGLDSVAARERLRLELRAVDEQIERAKRSIAGAVVLPANDPRVAVGCAVTVADDGGERTIEIGGLVTAATRAGKLSYESPLARALLGREAGDEIEIADPSGTRLARVVAVKRAIGREPSPLGR